MQISFGGTSMSEMCGRLKQDKLLKMLGSTSSLKASQAINHGSVAWSSTTQTKNHSIAAPSGSQVRRMGNGCRYQKTRSTRLLHFYHLCLAWQLMKRDLTK